MPFKKNNNNYYYFIIKISINEDTYVLKNSLSSFFIQIKFLSVFKFFGKNKTNRRWYLPKIFYFKKNKKFFFYPLHSLKNKEK